MRTTFAVALFFAACQITSGQVVPSASTGRANLRYSFRYSEMAEFGGYLGNWHTITPSASLDYENGRKTFPFSMQYAGGYTSTLSGPSYSTGFFQHLLLSQGLSLPKWDFDFSDDVSYRPQSPTTGFSGIPGIGEPIGGGTNVPPGQLILTVNAHALDNIASGKLRRILNYRSIFNVEASHDLLHFPDDNGLDTTSVMTSAGIDLRLNARNSLTTRYAFSQFGYSGYDFHVRTNLVTFGFDRSWTRSLRMNAAVGPEWVNSSRAAAIPNSVGVSAQAALEYQKRRTTMAVTYSRQTSAGSGYMIGSESDDVSGSLSRIFHRAMDFEMNGGYRRTSQLGSDWNISGAYGGVQASWRIGRNANAFVNYTATSQTSNMHGPANVLNDLMHTISCGIGFTKETAPTR